VRALRFWCKLLGHDISMPPVPLVVTQIGAFFPPEETGTFLVCRRCQDKVRLPPHPLGCAWCGGSGRTLSDEKCAGCS